MSKQDPGHSICVNCKFDGKKAKKSAKIDDSESDEVQISENYFKKLASRILFQFNFK